MPIDPAMAYELVEEWLPSFLDVEAMTPTHPLRAGVIESADLAICDSYLYAARSTAESGSLDDEYLRIAEDVIQVLRGVASWITNHTDGSAT